MGYSHQIFCAILFIFVLISFLNYQILMSGASLSAVNNSVERGMKEFYWVEDSSETQIKIRKVSGNDENEEKTALILEKFRLLLGLNNVHLRSPKHDHVEHGFSAPSPASSIEAEAPVPVHSHHHHPSLHPSPAQPPNKAQYGNGNKARVKRRIVIAILVSIGATLVLFVLGLILALQKLKTCCQRRYASRMVSRRGSKFENSSNSIIKVSSIPGPDLSYLDSLAPVSELEASCINHTCETLAISTKQELLKSLSDEVDGSCRKSTNAECDYVSCSSAEEILSVHARVEPIKSSSKSSSTYGSIHPELLSLDDESFHSFCDSYSSNVRLSNASEGGLSDPPNHCLRETTLPHSPTPPLTPDLEPPLYSNLHSSPESPIEIKQRTSISPSFNCLQDLLPPPPPPPTPPPPPPPPPPIFLDSPRHSDSSSGSNQGPTEYGTSSPIPTPIQSSITQLGSNGSIPPPPFPPLPPLLPTPFQKGQPPPPPQCVLPRSTPVGKNGEPLPKLKPLHWDKVRAAPDRSMVWDKLRSSSFELDEEMIESLFGYNFQSSIKNDEGMSKSSSPSRHILEPKRLQNITILLKTLNATIEQVCYALVQGDGLRLQQLEALLKMVPTKEEEAKLSNYQGNVNDLGPAERFVKMMLGIPFAFRRIEAMLYREIFEDEVVHLRKSFDILEEACKELRSSQIFLILLEAVLKTGNRMNVGTIRGGAKAFKLDALLKLADVKGTDGKTTLLHFVVQEMNRSEGIREFEISTKKSHPKVKNKTIDEREEDYRRMGLDLVSGMSAELCNVKKTATIDWDVLASSITTLSDGTIKLQHLIHKDLSMDAQSENFIHSMRSFLNHAEKSIKELQEDEDRVLSHVRDITEYFHGDVGKHEANPLEIFMIVGDFLAMLDEVCKELRSLKTPSGQNSVAPFR